MRLIDPDRMNGAKERKGALKMRKNFLKHVAIMLSLSLVMAAMPVVTAFAEEPHQKILIVAPHEDDEMLAFGGIIRAALDAGDEVRTVVITNGDATGGAAMGERRIKESFDAQRLVGVPENNIYFLGYGDTGWAASGDNMSFVGRLYHATDPDEVFTSNTGNQTFGNSTIGKEDYHYQTTGSHASYTRNNLLGDLQNLINGYRPDRIYTTSMFDFHWGHKGTGLFTNEAVLNIKRSDPAYSPIVCSSIIHGPTSAGGQDNNWPLIDNWSGPLQPFTMPADLEQASTLQWSNRVTVPVPASMNVTPREQNLKYQAIATYTSQLGSSWDQNYLYSFVKSDEFFWEKDYSNIAPLAAVSASSETPSTGQTKDKAIDGVTDGNPRFPDKEWVTSGELTGAWIQLDWAASHTVNKVVLYDRPNTVEQITGATLSFDDGSTVNVGALENSGRATVIEFAPKTTASIRLTVTGATGENIGLAEFEVFEGTDVPRVNLALGAAATASSNESDTRSAPCVCDGDMSTRWASQEGSDNEWIQLDLGESKPLQEIVLKWEDAYASQYKLELSADGEAWNEVYSTSSGAGGTESITLESQNTRYIKLTGVQRATPWGYSLWELEAY